MCRGAVTLRFTAASAACFRSHANLSAAVCVLRELLIVRTKSAAHYPGVRTENPAPFRRQDANTPSSRPEVRTENAESFPVSRAVRAAAHPGVRKEKRRSSAGDDMIAPTGGQNNNESKNRALSIYG